MRKRLGLILGSLVLAAGIAGFIALILFGMIGGVAMGVAPQATFGLAAPLLCPAGSAMEYHSVVRSYHRPGESEPHLECVATNGERNDVLGNAIVLVLAGVFVAVFLTVLLPLAVLLPLIALQVGKALGRRRASAPGDQGPSL